MTWKFEEFYEWANDYFNIDLHAYKENQLQRRINTIMERSGATTLDNYSELLEKDSTIRQRFIDYITINVTDFFRNEDLFKEFGRILIDELHPTFGPLKIWSAACSIGSEPYSLAIIAKENNVELLHKILATDIDDKVLERAREAVYSDYDLKNLSKDMIRKYFIQHEKKYELRPDIKQLVNFQKHDLLLDQYQRGFHAIVCRNVTIYFKEEAKDKIYQDFSDSLVTGGVLFTGATETIYRPQEFGLEKIGSFMYRKL